MTKMTLNEQEAAVVRKQFVEFLSGRAIDGNFFTSSELTMHSDGHQDSHYDRVDPQQP